MSARPRARGMAGALLGALLAMPVAAADLVVDIHDVHAQGGRLTVFLFDSEAAWNGRREVLARQRVYPNGGTRLQARFDRLRAGRYGVIVLHDRDGNGKFDVGPLGIPRDGYGFSNNPFVFKRPLFDKVAFEVPAAGKRITVQMK